VDEALKSLEDARTFLERENGSQRDLHALAGGVHSGRDGTTGRPSSISRSLGEPETASLPPPRRSALSSDLGAAPAYSWPCTSSRLRGPWPRSSGLWHRPATTRTTGATWNVPRADRSRGGKYDEALDHLQKADPENPYNWFYKRRPREEGRPRRGSELYGKIVGWNQNDLATRSCAARVEEDAQQAVKRLRPFGRPPACRLRWGGLLDDKGEVFNRTEAHLATVSRSGT